MLILTLAPRVALGQEKGGLGPGGGGKGGKAAAGHAFSCWVLAFFNKMKSPTGQSQGLKTGDIMKEAALYSSKVSALDHEYIGMKFFFKCESYDMFYASCVFYISYYTMW